MATMASFRAVVNIGCAALWVSIGLQWNRRKNASEAEYNNFFEKSSNIRLEKQQDKFFFSLLLLVDLSWRRKNYRAFFSCFHLSLF